MFSTLQKRQVRVLDHEDKVKIKKNNIASNTTSFLDADIEKIMLKNGTWIFGNSASDFNN